MLTHVYQNCQLLFMLYLITFWSTSSVITMVQNNLKQAYFYHYILAEIVALSLISHFIMRVVGQRLLKTELLTQK